VTLDREDIEAFAQRLVQLIGHQPGRSELGGIGPVDRHLGGGDAWIDP
jgi:hypothetical protein